MSHRLLVAFCAWLLVITMSPRAVSAQSDTSTLVPGETYADTELLAALESGGVLEAWLAASPLSPEASLVDAMASDDYAAARADLMVRLSRLKSLQQAIERQEARHAAAQWQLDTLADLVRTMRQQLVTQQRSAAVAFTKEQVEQARITLHATRVEVAPVSGGAIDPVSAAQNRLSVLQKQLGREVDLLSRPRLNGHKSTDAAISRLTTLSRGVPRIEALLSLGRADDSSAHMAFSAERAAVLDLMPGLHEQRTLRATSVAGLSLVTVDAYVQAASTLDPSCPVDWALLAGIGRIESFHGTIDDSLVLTSGQVTIPILGPLLDGGATAREAVEAAALAEAEAEEAARIAAEELAAEEAALEKYRAELYGLELVEDEEESEPEEPAPGAFDPLLWGEVPNTEPLEAVDGEGEGDDEDEPELLGNGFAVIEDSDDGRLDGNARWDRAVGPMQFIPETWSYFATDGNDDGIADPQNLYDAAATAGKFLCHLSRRNGPDPSVFVLGYNSSSSYVRAVMRYADEYRSRTLPTG